MSLIRHPNEFARSQTIVPVAPGSASTAPTHAPALPNGWWIIPMATLGGAMWYWMISGIFALFG
jgi:hypothetical protein